MGTFYSEVSGEEVGDRLEVLWKSSVVGLLIPDLEGTMTGNDSKGKIPLYLPQNLSLKSKALRVKGVLVDKSGSQRLEQI